MASEFEVFEFFWTPTLKKAELAVLKGHKGWFDIRDLTPVARTERLGSIFTDVARDFIRRYQNDAKRTTFKNGKFHDWNPIKRDCIFDASVVPPKRMQQYVIKVRSLIKGRQYLDDCGIPYDFACKTIINAFMFDESYLRKFSHLPQPLLLNNKKMRALVLCKWVENLKSRVQYVNDPKFIVKPDSPVMVKEHEAFILQQIGMQVNKSLILKSLLSKGFVSEESAKEHFGHLI